MEMNWLYWAYRYFRGGSEPLPPMAAGSGPLNRRGQHRTFILEQTKAGHVYIGSNNLWICPWTRTSTFTGYKFPVPGQENCMTRVPAASEEDKMSSGTVRAPIGAHGRALWEYPGWPPLRTHDRALWCLTRAYCSTGTASAAAQRSPCCCPSCRGSARSGCCCAGRAAAAAAGTPARPTLAATSLHQLGPHSKNKERPHMRYVQEASFALAALIASHNSPMDCPVQNRCPRSIVPPGEAEG